MLRARARQSTDKDKASGHGVAAPPEYVLIDYENVQPTGVEWLRGRHCRVKVFIGPNQPKVPVELAHSLQELGDGSGFVMLDSSGRNALDFCIAYYIGVFSAREPGASFLIVSNDQGFDPLIEHLNSKGIEAKRASPTRHPFVEPEDLAAIDDQVAMAVTHLAAMKASRPGKQKTLMSTLNVVVFKKELSKQELNALFVELCRRGIVKQDGSRLSYRLPNEEQPKTLSVRQQSILEPKSREEFDDQVAAAVSRLIAMKTAVPGKKMTLINTLAGVFKNELTQQQLHGLFGELCQRGIVRTEGSRLSYRLPREEQRQASNGRSVSKKALPVTANAVAATVNAPAALIAAYEQRTREHIRRVRRCMKVMASVTPHKLNLEIRAIAHDGSKFGPSEFEPYVWLNEFHRCQRAGEPFEYPEGMEERVHAAIRHHVTTNRHHPEFHADPNGMTEVDLIEMVCDWTAMALELGQDGGSALGWADRTIGKRIKFNDEKRAFVYRMIELLDQHLSEET